MKGRLWPCMVACALMTACVPTATRDRPVSSQPTGGSTVVQGITALPDLSIFTTAVTAAGLAGTLASARPLTMFAPTNQAFGRLAPDTLAALFRPANRSVLVKLVKLHVLAEALSGDDLMARIAAGGGETRLTGMGGEQLTLSMTGTAITLTDSGGDKSYIERADLRQSNGVVHVVNGVLIPRLD